MACDEWYRSARVVPCSFGDPASTMIAVLWGDSVGAQWFSALAQPLVEQGWYFLVLTKSACPIVDEPVFYARIGMEYTKCSDWRAAALDFLARVEPDIIFMGSADTYDYTHEQWLQGTRRILDELSPAAEQIYLLQANYQLPFDGPYCLARRDWQPAVLSGLTDCTAAGIDASDTGVTEVLQQVSLEFANVRLLNFNPLICPQGHCAAQKEMQIVFRDHQHLTNSYVETLTPQIKNLLDPRLFAVPDPAPE